MSTAIAIIVFGIAIVSILFRHILIGALAEVFGPIFFLVSWILKIIFWAATVCAMAAFVGFLAWGSFVVLKNTHWQIFDGIDWDVVIATLITFFLTTILTAMVGWSLKRIEHFGGFRSAFFGFLSVLRIFAKEAAAFSLPAFTSLARIDKGVRLQTYKEDRRVLYENMCSKGHILRRKKESIELAKKSRKAKQLREFEVVRNQLIHEEEVATKTKGRLSLACKLVNMKHKFSLYQEVSFDLLADPIWISISRISADKDPYVLSIQCIAKKGLWFDYYPVFRVENGQKADKEYSSINEALFHVRRKIESELTQLSSRKADK